MYGCAEVTCLRGNGICIDRHADFIMAFTADLMEQWFGDPEMKWHAHGGPRPSASLVPSSFVGQGSSTSTPAYKVSKMDYCSAVSGYPHSQAPMSRLQSPALPGMTASSVLAELPKFQPLKAEEMEVKRTVEGNLSSCRCCYQVTGSTVCIQLVCGMFAPQPLCSVGSKFCDPKPGLRLVTVVCVLRTDESSCAWSPSNDCSHFFLGL